MKVLWWVSRQTGTRFGRVRINELCSTLYPYQSPLVQKLAGATAAAHVGSFRLPGSIWAYATYHCGTRAGATQLRFSEFCLIECSSRSSLVYALSVPDGSFPSLVVAPATQSAVDSHLLTNPITRTATTPVQFPDLSSVSSNLENNGWSNLVAASP